MYLGMDIGTSGVKAVLVNEAGAIVATAARELALSHPAPLWSEQDPDAWVDAAIGAVDDLARRASARGRAGARHRPVRPDARRDAARRGRPAAAPGHPVERRPLACRMRRARSGAARRCTRSPAISRCPASPRRSCSGSRGTSRRSSSAIAKVLLPKAYVRYRLTGEMVEDMSDAAGTLWLDVGQRRWSRRCCCMPTGLDRHHMPRLVEGSAAQRGARAGIRAALGHGERRRGRRRRAATMPRAPSASAPSRRAMRSCRSAPRACCSASPTGFAPAPAAAVHAFCHALPGLWHQMGVMLSAAGLAGLARGRDRRRRPPRCWRRSARRVDGPSPVKFLPYLAGERTPHNDAAARGAFVGLRGCDRARARSCRPCWKASPSPSRDSLAALSAAGAGDRRTSICVGGGSRSRAVGADLRRRARHSRRTASRRARSAAALGAARLGRLAATGDDPARGLHAPAAARETIAPDAHPSPPPTTTPIARYRELYPAIEGGP